MHQHWCPRPLLIMNQNKVVKLEQLSTLAKHTRPCQTNKMFWSNVGGKYWGTNLSGNQFLVSPKQNHPTLNLPAAKSWSDRPKSILSPCSYSNCVVTKRESKRTFVPPGFSRIEGSTYHHPGDYDDDEIGNHYDIIPNGHLALWPIHTNLMAWCGRFVR